MRRTSHPVRAAAVAVLLSVAVGCGGSSSPDAPGGAPEGVYEIRGTVVSLDVPRRIVEINHEEIPGVMAAMSMPYEVADAGLLQGLAAGDRVRGTLRVDRRGYVITALQKV